MTNQIPPRPEARSTLDEYLDWWLHVAVEGTLRAKTPHGITGRSSRCTCASRWARSGSTGSNRSICNGCCGLTNRELSARTVRYTHAVLRSALDQARGWKLLVENPAVGMPLPRAGKREFHVLTPDEAQRFAAFCREVPAGLVFLVALTTLLRPREAPSMAEPTALLLP